MVAMMDAQYTDLDSLSIEVDYLEIDNELFLKLFKSSSCSACEGATRCFNCTRSTHWVQS